MERPKKPNRKHYTFTEEEDYFKSLLTGDVNKAYSRNTNKDSRNETTHKHNINQAYNNENYSKKSNVKNYQSHQNYYGTNIKNKNYIDESEHYYNNEDNFAQTHNSNYPTYLGTSNNNYYDHSDKYSNYGDYSGHSQYYNYNRDSNHQENYYNTNYYNNNHSHNKFNKNYDKDKHVHKKSHSHNDSTINYKKQKINGHLKNLHVEVPEMTMNHINGLIEASIDCMICGENISTITEIWQCNTCYTLYHNKCIYDWIFKLNSSKTGIKELFKWTCPHCSQNYQAISDKLPTYNCYCERFYTALNSGNKEFDPDLIPHGCGLKCGKEICPHVKCSLPCHPGPHLSCNFVEKIKCFCSKTEKEINCTNPNKKFSCNQKCETLLKCSRHKCRVSCHEGDCEQYLKNKKCEECVEESKTKFHKFLKDLESKINSECKVNLYSFADRLSEFIFNGTLFCMHHQEDPNTDNNLQFFLRLIKISGNKLIENIQKFIPICNKVVENSCDCKSKSTNVECYKLNYPKDILKFLGLTDEKEIEKCTKICKTLKSCKIHKCNRVCCELANKVIKNYSIEDPLGYHLCLIPCEKLLACKKHKCENYCHKGSCKPCATIIREGSISCDCGKTKIQAPYQCGMTIECKNACDKPRKCEHKCKLTCHVGECPPCEEITFKVCNCKKNIIQNLKCGDHKIPTCFTACNEMLPCGVHFCQIKCHDHTEEYDINYFCSLQCGRDFLKCKHKCTKRCHGEDECREIDCESIIKITCSCKVNIRNMKCGEYKKLIDNDPSYVLQCNEECKKKDRLKKIEQAFDGLLKFSDEKFKSMYKKPESAKDDENMNNLNHVKYSDIKFDHSVIEFAKNKIKFFIELEMVIDKAVTNLEKKFEIHNLDKKLYKFTSEILKNYYNIETKKEKKINDALCSLVLTDCCQAVLPKYKLSLLALLFKHRKFVEDPKINHPFGMSILIQNHRYSVTIEDIENHILYLTKSISKTDFYIDEITKGKCYVHFLNLELGQKIFKFLKNNPSQFQECYEHIYDVRDIKFEELYIYMKNKEYFNTLFYKDEFEKENSNSESASAANPKSSDDEIDKDGFVKVKKGKKPK